jgi:hypothetical protein
LEKAYLLIIVYSFYPRKLPAILYCMAAYINLKAGTFTPAFVPPSHLNITGKQKCCLCLDHPLQRSSVVGYQNALLRLNFFSLLV